MAGASTTKDVRIFMTKGTPATVVGVTGITAAKPAALTGAGMTLVAGDVVTFDKTGLANFDGKSFVVAATPAPTATSVTLVGTDNTGGATTLAGGAVVTAYAGTTGLQDLCLSQLSISVDAPGTIDVSTFCGAASLPVPAANVGSVTIGGYVDPTASDFLAIKSADELGDKRIFRVTMPNGTFLLMEGILSGLTYGLELNQAITWSATITLTSKPRYTL